jgi:hypothetical protein
VAPSAAEWNQDDGHALVRGHGERVESSSVDMSAMMAVLKLYQTRQKTFSSALSVLHGALGAQRKAQKRACKLARGLDVA